MFEIISAYFFKISKDEMTGVKDTQAFKTFCQLQNKQPSQKAVAVWTNRIISFSCLRLLLLMGSHPT